jgi:hypothetical protein
LLDFFFFFFFLASIAFCMRQLNIPPHEYRGVQKQKASATQ